MAVPRKSRDDKRRGTTFCPRSKFCDGQTETNRDKIGTKQGQIGAKQGKVWI